jgi:hypothetical protein
LRLANTSSKEIQSEVSGRRACLINKQFSELP